MIGLICLPVIVSYAETETDYTRKDLDKIDKEIDKNRKKILELNDKIIEQRETIDKNEDEIDIKKEELRTVKRTSNDSWDSALEIMDAKEKVRDAETKFTDSQRELLELLNERSRYMASIEPLKEKILFIKNELKKQDIPESEIIISPSSNFTGYTKKIGVTLASSCITLIQNNITTTCPTYEDLVHLDSSIQRVSGEFTIIDDFFQRLNSNYEESWRWYDFDNNLRVFIDPPNGMAERIKMIEIRNNFGIYEVDILNNVLNNPRSLVYYKDRSIDNCENAVISSDKWQLLLNDTIKYLQSNCEDGMTQFNSTEIIPLPRTEIDITTSPQWQYEQWVKQALIDCKQRC